MVLEAGSKWLDKWVMIAKPHGLYHVIDTTNTTSNFFLPDPVKSEDAVSAYEMLLQDRTRALAVHLIWED